MREISAKRLFIAVAFIIVIAGGGVFFWFFTAMSSTRQAINYEVKEIPLPLHLKTMQFMTRFANYHWLLDRLLDGNESELETVRKLQTWAYTAIRPQPESLPVIDDHVWDIVVRGYGKPDQRVDVIATLCNLSDIPAMPILAKRNNEDGLTLLAFRHIGQWCFSDPARDVFFMTGEGRFAEAAQLLEGRFVAMSGGQQVDFDYRPYFSDILHDYDELHRVSRSNIQDPVSRLLAYLY